MPHIRSGCKIDYGTGRLFFAGEVAGFLNPMGEGISAGMESGHAVALSVIEHLFPDGNGLAIFDDPFTDMDEDRVKEGCNLINQFSKNNQVIFVTCDKKYINEFPGANVINM